MILEGREIMLLAFCIPWASCGIMWSNEEEGFMQSFDTSRKIYSVTFFFTEPVLSVAITHSVVFSFCHLVVNMELILCVVRSGYNIFRASAVFFGIWVEKNQTPRNVASFTRPVDLVELTLPGCWHGVFPGQWVPAAGQGMHTGNRVYVLVEPGVAGPSVPCWRSPRPGPGSSGSC